ncbi:MAG TPA: 2-oxo acid dehydrogenase subunit E2 [Steroidobacteraceae bacterium]|jgi:2-oxoglutarate dehydrogenase E2 component (dihydrolipoamide succinyltransferase)|nr:2-oxo acid dehydrogenase subunit E2 [Steroidobacteraceae bacterium]
MSSIKDVLAPQNEEGTRATILKWCKAVGDTVVKDEPLVELETDKVTVEVPAPASGTLIEVLKLESAEVSPDEVLARLELADESTQSLETKAPTAAAKTENSRGSANTRTDSELLSPSVRRLLHEHDISPGAINGTGRNGRVTAQDVTRHVSQATHVSAAPASRARPAAPGAPIPAAAKVHQGDANTRVAHTVIRRRVAEHMVRSLSEAPHVTTLFEADLSRVLKHRASHAQGFESRGARLTLTVYFISACVRALRMHPEVNATFHQDAMELHGDVNIGVGTALGDKGLIVPVIHRAQQLSLFEIAQRLQQTVDAARAGKLAPQDVRGGTFTISNHGVGGSLLAAPIVINQPQVAILGVGKVQRRVCVIEADGSESIAVRPMCYLTLTIDHRALDAFQANAFLALVVKTLEQWPDTAEALQD